MLSGWCRLRRRGSWRSFLVLPLALGILASLGTGTARAQVTDPKRSPGISREMVEKYRQDARRRHLYQRCLRLGKFECHRKYRDAVVWCTENWRECLPRIRGSATAASEYGDQVKEECMAELERRCREEGAK